MSREQEGLGGLGRQQMEVEIEIKKFLSLPNEDRLLTNPIEWWLKKGKPLFPLIARVALKYCIIPATSTPCERIFSIAGCVLSERRANLSDKSARALIFLHEILK